jgi:NAD-dependent deacetylase
MMQGIDIVRGLVAEASSIAVLTGAGVSAESGVATFRDPDGLWARFSPQELASMDGFLANPQRVREWYDYRRRIIASVEPNEGHYALAALERQRGGGVTIVTQNVDRLHQRAGSVNVLEVHGNIIENRCNGCGSISMTEDVACTACGGMMRPNVVWFGEELPHDVFAQAEQACRECDVMLVVGTSAEVYPAAGLPITAARYGAVVVEINPNPTALSDHAHHTVRASSAVALPQIFQETA